MVLPVEGVGVEEESTSMARRSTAESLVDSIAESSLRMLECSVGAALCLLDTASLLFIGARERGVQRRSCAVAMRAKQRGFRTAECSTKRSRRAAETVEGGESSGNAEAAKIGAGDV
jgi:hypothetical protein